MKTLWAILIPMLFALFVVWAVGTAANWLKLNQGAAQEQGEP